MIIYVTCTTGKGTSDQNWMIVNMGRREGYRIWNFLADVINGWILNIQSYYCWSYSVMHGKKWLICHIITSWLNFRKVCFWLILACYAVFERVCVVSDINPNHAKRIELVYFRDETICFKLKWLFQLIVTFCFYSELMCTQTLLIIKNQFLCKMSQKCPQ